MNEKVKIEVVSGKFGNSLCLNDLRIAGPKAWGGGTIIHTFQVELETLREALEEIDFGEGEPHDS